MAYSALMRRGDDSLLEVPFDLTGYRLDHMKP